MPQAAARWVLLRIAGVMTTVIAASAGIWLLAFGLSGDPATAMLGATATPDRVAALRLELGLDRPLPVQYGAWLGGLLTGDLGTSLHSGTPVAELLGPRLRNSAVVAALAGALTLAVGVPLGIAAGCGRGWIATTALAISAIPDFVVATCAVWLLAIQLHWLPALSTVRRDGKPWDRPEILVIPVVAMALVLLGWCVRSVAAVIQNNRDHPAAVTARVNGVPEAEVLRTYVLPQALAPLVQFLGWLVAGAIGAATVIEQLIGYPGVGALLVDAVTYRDLPAVASIGTVLAAIVAGAVALCDGFGALLDPRMRPWRTR